MKQGSNQRRSRGRNPNGGGRRNSRNHTFESNGPEVKVRGTAQQVLDKYLQLARDVQSGGDRENAEAYLQFAEHYFRVLNVEREAEQGEKRPVRTEGNEHKRVETEPGGHRSNRHNANPHPQRSQEAKPSPDTPSRDLSVEAQGESIQGESIQGESSRGEPTQDRKSQNVQGRRRRKPGVAKPKNEATAAAEAAAANGATPTGAVDEAPVEKSKPKVESKRSSQPSASKNTTMDDAEEAAANA